MLELGVKFLISYLIGSLMGSMIMGRLRGGVDIREMGSGNPGGTNALRTQGVWFALGVMIIDVGKGVVGAAVVPGLELPFIAEDPGVSREWLTLCCAAAAVMGHVWPLYHGFRGGKGAATLVGAVAVVAPGILVPALLVFVVILVLSGFVGLSTMSAAVTMPAWVAITGLEGKTPLFVFGVFMAGFIIYCHRSNIARMRAGNENRNEKLMLFKRKPQADGNGGV
ncbi:MAG: glycerol-3-phosphate 1-O-acyltransferase PlsY [Woeseiaceae bacterium]|nr:glycerol-3-phosphate 1-O-acyltransferase PlsY [Woeseiaceae bacterium]